MLWNRRTDHYSTRDEKLYQKRGISKTFVNLKVQPNSKAFSLLHEDNIEGRAEKGITVKKLEIKN